MALRLTATLAASSTSRISNGISSIIGFEISSSFISMNAATATATAAAPSLPISDLPKNKRYASYFSRQFSTNGMSESSSSGSSNINDGDENELVDPSLTLLYRASPSKATRPRTLLATTTLHTGFWTWYVLDFLPSLAEASAIYNASVEKSSLALENMDAVDAGLVASEVVAVDLTGGYIGLGLAIFMSVGACVYPRALISEISRRDGTGSDDGVHGGKDVILVKTYSLPMIQPYKTPAEYAVGDIIIDSSKDVLDIINDHNGDMGKFRGHMAIHAQGSYTNYLLNITSDQDSNVEMVNKDLLFHSLSSRTSSQGRGSTGKKLKLNSDEPASLKIKSSNPKRMKAKKLTRR